MREFTPDKLTWMLRRAMRAGWVAPLLLTGQVAFAAEANLLTKVDVAAESDGSVVTISGSRPPVYTAFRLANPQRVVLDVADGDVTAVQGTVAGQGPIEKVAASRFSDGKTAVGRIVISLADEAQYQVTAEGDRVRVHVRGASADLKTKDSAVAAPSHSDDHVVSVREDDSQVPNPATRVLSAGVASKGAVTRILVSTDAEVGPFTVTELRDPPRLAIDLKGVKGSSHLRAVPAGVVRGVRGSKREDGFRVVVDAADDAGPGRVQRVKGGLAVVFGPEEVPRGAGLAVHQPKAGRVQDVNFAGDGDSATVAIAGTSLTSYDTSHPDDHTAVLTLHGTKLPSALVRSLDTASYGAPVKSVSTFVSDQGENEVQVVAKVDGATADSVSVSKNGLHWTFTGQMASEMSIDGVEVSLSESKVAGLQSEGPAYAVSGAPRKPKYTGRRVSFEFKDIDIHNLLRIIAEVAKKNIVVSDEVSGKITIRLRNVPWDQALDVILKSKGLDKDESGNILRVLPAAKLAEERALEKKARDDAKENEEPKLRLIAVNYATAGEMSERIKELLSKKGSVTIDPRTNTLIVKDVPGSLTRVEGMVRTLDLQTPEVLIEARIVEANTTFSHDVGIQWGGQLAFAPAFGNPTGLVFPSTAVVSGASGTGTAAGVQSVPNFAVDLPAATGTGAGGGLGFIFGSAGGAATLNLRIAAAESSGTAKTISAPKVTTLDNLKATISQGVAIPFSQFSASGVNTAFIEAKLELSVTPHVTQDGSIQMKVDATNNQPNAAFTGSNGQPSITKKEAHTNVLVRDGDTTVIGGIYTRATGENEAIVPILGKIPVLGYFFRHRFETDSRTELLIFITPHIVNRSQTVAVATPAPNP